MRIIFHIFILASSVQRIRSDWDYDTEEEKEIVSSPELENNFVENQGNSVIPRDFTEDTEKFGDYELQKLFVQNFKLHKHRDSYKEETSQNLRPQRKIRALKNFTVPINGMECFTCYANGRSPSDEKCYYGVDMHRIKCADAENCFTELHPTYLRRGCMAPGRLNRTFSCKCPLCNDKPSYESIHYEYKEVRDWAYDNVRLANQVAGLDLMCKVCETRGSNAITDKHCRSGKDSDYMICSRNQLCYTNIDDESDYVSRGCINKPAFNSMYFFCKTAKCNNEKFSFPGLRISEERLLLRDKPYLKNIDVYSLIAQPKNCHAYLNANKNLVLLLSIKPFLFNNFALVMRTLLKK